MIKLSYTKSGDGVNVRLKGMKRWFFIQMRFTFKVSRISYLIRLTLSRSIAAAVANGPRSSIFRYISSKMSV